MDTLISPPPAAPRPPRPRRFRLPVGRGLVAVVAALGLLALAGGWAIAQSVSAPRTVADPTVLAAPQSGIAGEVSGQSARTHLEALQRIADANGGNRASGSAGYAASVDYVVGVLKQAGWDVHTEQFTHTGRHHGDDGDHGGDAPKTDTNIIAQTRTGDPNHVVMAGAHLDSVPDGPGINDNATGAAALLEIATRTGGSPDVPNALRFAFWGGEELGMYGSTAYVAGLPPAERQKLKAYLNLDMLGSPNPGYFTIDGDQSAPPDDQQPVPRVPEGSAGIERTLVDYLKGAGKSPEDINFEGRSDYSSFTLAGVPAGGIYSGAEENMTAAQAARWGGRADQPFDPNYHKATDTLDHIDRTALEINGRGVAYAVGIYAQDQSGHNGLPVRDDRTRHKIDS